MEHYHVDTGDLPWPGPRNADCHYGDGLTKPNTDSTTTVTLTNPSYDIIVNVLRDRLAQIRREYDDAYDVGANTSLHRWRRDMVLAALREMGVDR